MVRVRHDHVCTWNASRRQSRDMQYHPALTSSYSGAMSGANRTGREDLPRITVDSITDWRRIQASYTASAIKQLDEQLAANGLSHEREAHLAHLNAVSITFMKRSSVKIDLYPVYNQDIQLCSNEHAYQWP